MRSPVLPLWSPAVLAVLFVPTVLPFEAVFSSGVGAIAAGAGVGVGLLLALASRVWRWDALATGVSAAAAYLLLGGAAALRETTIAGVVPTLRTVRLLVSQAAFGWKDLLTLAPPASSYTGPAVIPWLAGLACGLASGLLTLRSRRPALGVVPMLLLAGIGVAWGVAGTHPPGWPAAVWFAGLLGWTGYLAHRQRSAGGEALVIGRAATAADPPSGRRIVLVHPLRRLLAGVATLAVALGVAVPVVSVVPAFDERIVLRDLVEPPLDVREYPTPLSSMRHYTTDLDRTPLITLSNLPKGARVRLGVMDTYNGIVFGMSDPVTSEQGRYLRSGEQVGSSDAPTTTIDVTISDLTGPWLPTVGDPQRWVFTGEDAEALADGFHVNRWAQAALSTAAHGRASYTLTTVVTPEPADGQLAGVRTPPITVRGDTGVPQGVADLAQKVAAGRQEPLARARAIERHLSTTGFFARDEAYAARPGHRQDRLARMLADEQLIGDDEQYSVLMALMLRSLGVPSRVVMGAYPSESAGNGPVVLTGDDVRAWVEVPFEGVGWAVFDPTPPRDQVPQTEVPRPRAVPRPQVLQPPEPPEPQVELPPAASQRDVDDARDEVFRVPWALIGIGLGLWLIIGGPIVAVLTAKASRAGGRRSAADPASAIAGAWAEIIDRAVDAGATIPPALTRNEIAARLGATVWSTARTPTPDPPSSSGPAGDLGWDPAGATPHALVTLARRADTASFAPGPPDPEAAAEAWRTTDELTAELAASVGLWTRLRRRLSLRSLRRARRLHTGATGRRRWWRWP